MNIRHSGSAQYLLFISFLLSNFILIIKNTADHTEWLLAEKQSVPEGPVVGHQVYDSHKTRVRSERGLPEWRAFCLHQTPHQPTALEISICLGFLLLFCFVSWCMCKSVYAHTLKDINETGMKCPLPVRKTKAIKITNGMYLLECQSYEFIL